MIIFIDYDLFKVIIKCWLYSIYCILCVCMCVCVSFSGVWLFVTPMDYSLSGSSLHEIFQARILERVAISYSRGCSQPRCGSNPHLLLHLLYWQADSLPLCFSGKPTVYYILASYLFYIVVCINTSQSPLIPFLCLALPPSGNHSLVLYIHDSVCFVICVCLFAFYFIYFFKLIFTGV